MKATILTLIATFTFFTSFAQKNNWVSNNIFGTNNFIENKGQFDFFTPDHIKSDFAYIYTGNEIYLSEKGFTFRLSKLELKDEFARLDEHELKEEKERKEVYNRIDNWVSLEWIGANNNAFIQANNKTKHYITYGEKKYDAHGYESVRYNNIYDGIDVLFEIHPKGGLKYTLFLAPGADINDIQFKYSGQKKLSLIGNEKIVLNTEIEDMWEGNIYAYYKNGAQVNIGYEIKNGIVNFTSDKPLDKNQALVIDPWVTTNTTLTGSTGPTGGENKAYDVDFDLAGNLYVIGGGGVLGTTPNAYPKIAKYDPNGVLLWTFSGVVVAPAWNSSPGLNSYSRVGNLVVNKFSGKTYISQGLRVSVGVQIIRLDAAGNYDNFITVANSQFLEVWEMKFNCSTSEVVGMGGGTSSNINFGIIDTTTGAVTISNGTGLAGIAQDMVCAAQGPNSEVYSIFSAGGVANKIFRINTTYNGNLWNTASGYGTFAEQQNKPFVSASAFSNGYNALAANANYLFYYDGVNIKAFNGATGAVVGAPTGISHQTVMQQGGIETNPCDEVFVGGKNGAIYKYSFTGATFNLMDSLVINGQSNRAIYDISYNSLNNKFYVSGDQFVATIDYIVPCLSNIQLQIDTLCPDSLRATILNPDPTATYTFKWYDSTTNTLLQTTTPNLGTYFNIITGLQPSATYTLTVLKNVPCQLQSTTVHIPISCFDTIIYKCPSDYYLLNNDTLFLPGYYKDTVKNELVLLVDYSISNQTVDASICNGDTYTLPSNQMVSIAGTYIDTLTDGNGCDSIITTNLVVNNSVLETANASICAGDTYTLPDNRTISAAGKYTSSFTTNVGCDSIIETTIELVQPPTITLPNDTVICEGTSIDLNIELSNPLATYLWSDNSTNAVRRIAQAGSYIATITIPPCVPVQDDIMVDIKECNCDIFIPNAFSPNGDTRNEIFKPNLNCIFYPTEYTFNVYNRWGQVVYTTQRYNEGWDGFYKNEAQPIATYFYTLKYRNPNSKKEFFYRGDVTLIR